MLKIHNVFTILDSRISVKDDYIKRSKSMKSHNRKKLALVNFLDPCHAVGFCKFRFICPLVRWSSPPPPPPPPPPPIPSPSQFFLFLFSLVHCSVILISQKSLIIFFTVFDYMLVKGLKYIKVTESDYF